MPTLVGRFLAMCLALVVAGLVFVPPRSGAALTSDGPSTSTASSTSADPPTSTVTLTWDDKTTLRNPGMGWMIYAEEFAEPLADADEFWATVDPYVNEASILYLRLPWSRLEPTEGHYAWNEDDNYQSLVSGARKRGLRLAFRVFVDSQDSHQQATPQFVFDAGADKYAAQSNAELFNPTIDDPVFREKFEAFLDAFGTEYDDPAQVDFVDMNTIGWWGEMHSIPGLDAETWTDTVRWLGSKYREVFQHVLLAININSDTFGYDATDEQLAAGAIMRRDSFGSTEWFSQKDKDAIVERWPSSLLVAENCYQSFTTRETACDESFKPIRKMLERVVSDAVALHANYLDLRHPEDVVTWVRDNPDLVHKFATTGGYRIGPTRATVPTQISGNPAKLSVTWQNTGVGRLPNDNPQWAGKYDVAYALLDGKTGEVAHRVVSSADPGKWVAGDSYVDIVDLAAGDVPGGRYQLATAIVDSTDDHQPAITLAVDAPERDGWVVLGEIDVEGATGSGLPLGLVIPGALVAVALLAGVAVVTRRSRRGVHRDAPS